MYANIFFSFEKLVINGRNFGPLRDDTSDYWWLHTDIDIISVKIKSQKTNDTDEFDGVCTDVTYNVENLQMTCDYPECTTPCFNMLVYNNITILIMFRLTRD